MGVYVEIVSSDVNKREGRNEGGHWISRTQEAFVHQGGPYPTPFTLRLDENQLPYQPGRYLFGPGSFRIGKWGLELSRELSLVPLGDALKRLGEASKLSVAA